MEAIIHIEGRITKDETLKDVIRQFKSYDEPSEVTVKIKSGGGNKDEGNAIYDYFKAIDAEIPVTTIAEKAYSISAKIFAAGRKRVVLDEENVLGVHFARVTPKGTFTAEQVEEIAEDLREAKQEFIDFYSEHLNIDKSTVEALLENETMMSGVEAVELAFATEVKESAEVVAELLIDKFDIKMKDETKKRKSFFKRMFSEMTAYLDEEEKEVVAEVTLQDSSGAELVFPDVEEGSNPVVGSAATVDGSAVEDGSYIMPSMEEATLVFEGGVVTEIKPKAEEAEEEAEVVSEEIQEVSVWAVNVTNNSFEMGEIVMYDYDGESYPVSAGEFQLKNGNRIITDASGKIVAIKTSEDLETEEEIEVDTEASFEDLLKKVTDKVKAELTADMNEQLAKKDEEILALKRAKGSKEINAEVIVDEVPVAKVANQNGLTGAFLRGKK